MPNRLASEQSPYLLQHANNPVDWYPWGDAAFAAARSTGRPIFLSIGYATCHWCHVMEHESFEDPKLASVLNEHFISVKVDREERPDIDGVYMSFVQATTGAGGWPMSVWLTPDLQPFYGGTYFPPHSQYGRPAFRDVLLEVARAWREDRDKVQASAKQIVDRLAIMAQGETDRRIVDAKALSAAFQQFLQTFDTRRGGFGDAPKFPRPSELLFLLREHARTGEQTALDMVVRTLRAMSLGGMRDHIGGGFHRYSVDGNWRVPHFEKMLYDQAQITLACLEVSQAAGDPFFSQIAEDTLQYVGRDMTDARGGFFSAEDADSVQPEHAFEATPHKSEGAFYIWAADEIHQALGDDAAVFNARYGVLPGGNAPFDPQNEFSNKNLLYTAASIADIARTSGRESGHVAEALMAARRILFDRREKRPRPELDDKVLTAWNGLMIAAFARAARVLEDGAGCAASAERAAEFVQSTLWDEQHGRLLRRYRLGEAAIDAYAEDYAYLIFGLLELFQSTGKASWLAWARRLQTRQDELFWDGVNGAWFSTTGSDPSVLVRMKEEYDGAEPSPSSVAALNLLTLAHLTGESAYAARATEAIQAFGGRLSDAGRAVPMMACALAASVTPGEQIVVIGDPAGSDTQVLWRAANQKYRPFAVVVPVVPKEQSSIAEHMPWVAAMKMVDGKPTVYVCRNFACEAPSTTADALR
jgi:uncharacterized protein YyaL (SSP411 family)